MNRARSAVFILLCVFALFLPGCVTGPGFGKAERDQPPKEMKQPAATEEMTHPAATETKPATKPQSPEVPSAPPPPMKPPAIGGSGG
ncbi:MAG TPA: hypothetical protein VE201_05005 [Nitrospirales bacterium]|nr:hypothetical protein [Nitrospirales bacterium]